MNGSANPRSKPKEFDETLGFRRPRIKSLKINPRNLGLGLCYLHLYRP